MISYAVEQRTREFGLRLALGARPQQVLALVLCEGLAIACGGIMLGLAAAWALSQFLAAQLYETRPHDPLTFVAVPSVVLLVALLACWWPARRALRIAPMTALRCE